MLLGRTNKRALNLGCLVLLKIGGFTGCRFQGSSVRSVACRGHYFHRKNCLTPHHLHQWNLLLDDHRTPHKWLDEEGLLDVGLGNEGLDDHRTPHKWLGKWLLGENWELLGKKWMLDVELGHRCWSESCCSHLWKTRVFTRTHTYRVADHAHGQHIVHRSCLCVLCAYHFRV
jgi:hypothetical protein